MNSIVSVLLVVLAIAIINGSGGVLADFCQNSPCGSFACHSVPELSAYLCSCPNGVVMNTSCANTAAAAACTSNVCLNGGNCSLLNPEQFMCSCPINYAGQYCEVSLYRANTCAIVNPCQNGGTCLMLPNNINFACSCPVSATGTQCQTNISPCNTYANLCLNGATCTDVVSSSTGLPVNYTCTCAPGYTGSSCQTPVDLCVNQTCSGNGLCFNTVGGQFKCVCFSGWTGNFCQSQLVCDPVTYPCLNGGVCSSNGTLCTCPQYFAGQRCDQITAPICAMNICSNGGTCYQMNITLYCSCLNHFSGQYCQNVVIVG